MDFGREGANQSRIPGGRVYVGPGTKVGGGGREGGKEGRREKEERGTEKEREGGKGRKRRREEEIKLKNVEDQNAH